MTHRVRAVPLAVWAATAVGLWLPACKSDQAKTRPAAKSEASSATTPEAEPKSDAQLPAPARHPGPIPTETTQLIVSVADGWQSPTARMTRYEREPGGAWSEVGESWPSVLGARGLAWGRGLHGVTRPSQVGGPQDPIKREGDGRSPAGVFSLGASYGYADQPPPGTEIDYHKVGPTWVCVDDSTSKHYNRVFDGEGMAVDWASAEVMRRRDDLYRWVVFVDHNVDFTTDGGSCIFLHVWRNPHSGTAGCSAMASSHMEELLGWLLPQARPVLVQLPQLHYQALRQLWRLP